MKRKKTLMELFRYGMAGITTTFVNLLVYHIFLIMGIDYKKTNLIALIFSKVYGYTVNKLFVFRSHCRSKRELLIEISSFISARGFTGLIDYFGLIAMVELFDINEFFSKYIIQVVVIIFNYIFGKFWIFRKDNLSKKINKS